VNHAGGPATLTIFDMAGRTVTTLHDGDLTAGEHSFVWNTSGVPAGVYMARLESTYGSVSARGVVIR